MLAHELAHSTANADDFDSPTRKSADDPGVADYWANRIYRDHNTSLPADYLHRVSYGATFSTDSGADIAEKLPGVTLDDELIEDGDTIDWAERIVDSIVFTPTSDDTLLLDRRQNNSDELASDSGDDYIYGFEGNDKLNGKAGNDCLYGSEGEDELVGGEGDDKLFGHANPNLSNPTPDDLADDTADYSDSTSGIVLDPSTLTETEQTEGFTLKLTDGLGGTDLLQSIEKIKATAFADTLVIEGDITTFVLKEFNFGDNDDGEGAEGNGKGKDILDLRGATNLSNHQWDYEGSFSFKGVEWLYMPDTPSASEEIEINIDQDNAGDEFLIDGGGGGDTLTITSDIIDHRIYLFAEGEGDTLEVISGRTDIYGGADIDTLSANGDGDFYIFGGEGNDNVAAGDFLNGPADGSHVFGGAGEDVLEAFGDDIHLYGLSIQNLTDDFDPNAPNPSGGRQVLVDDGEQDIMYGSFTNPSTFHVGQNDVVDMIGSVVLYASPFAGSRYLNPSHYEKTNHYKFISYLPSFHRSLFCMEFLHI